MWFFFFFALFFQVPEVYTPVLEHLVVLQINSFPRYSEKMQLVCCRSIIKVFLALSIKGPVLWNFISTVGESVILTLLFCFFSPLMINCF